MGGQEGGDGEEAPRGRRVKGGLSIDVGHPGARSELQIACQSLFIPRFSLSLPLYSRW